MGRSENKKKHGSLMSSHSFIQSADSEFNPRSPNKKEKRSTADGGGGTGAEETIGVEVARPPRGEGERGP